MMKIRRATAKDALAIKKLIKLYPGRLLQIYLPKIKEFFVAVIGRKIVGCCALVVYSKRLAEIRSLAVEKDFQNRGIATKLIEECIKLAEKKKIYEIITITGADGIFKRHGFAAFHKEKFALLKFMK